MALWQRRKRDSGTVADTPSGTAPTTADDAAGDTLVDVPDTPGKDGAEASGTGDTPAPKRRARRRAAAAVSTGDTADAKADATADGKAGAKAEEKVSRTQRPAAEPAKDTTAKDTTAKDTAAQEEPAGKATAEPATPPERRRFRDAAPLTLLQAAHPRQGLATAVALAGAALLAGRPAREAAVVGATVLVGQTILGWHNDLVDRERDAEHGTPRKPIAEGRLDPGTAWYALAIAVLLLVPLSISTGITAGAFYLVSLLLGILGNVALRTGLLSFVPWAAAFALYPFYLAQGGWGGDAVGDPPQVVLVVLAALLGVGVHLLRSIWGLVADDKDGWTYLPLRLGRRLGATKLLVVAASYTAIVVALIAIVGSTSGLRA